MIKNVVVEYKYSWRCEKDALIVNLMYRCGWDCITIFYG